MKSIEENASACQLMEEAAKMLGGVFTIRTNFDSKLNRSTSYIVTVPEEDSPDDLALNAAFDDYRAA